MFSTGGAAIKGLSLGGWQVAGLRSAVAALALALLVPKARRGWSRGTWLVGAAYAATLILFVLANKLTTAANTIFLQSSAPLYLLLLAPVALGERILRRDIGVMAAIAAGLLLFFLGAPPASRTAPDPRLGNWLAAGSGLTWALTLLGLRWLGRTQGSALEALRSVIAGNLLAAATCAPALIGAPIAASARDWLIVGYLGAGQIGLAYLLLSYGLAGVGAFEGSLLILVEPALNPIWTWLIHGERPGILAICGGATILAASTLRAALLPRPQRI